MLSVILKNIDLLESNKKTIIDNWMSYEIVQKMLDKNSLNKKFFKEKFAFKVFDFAVGVVKEKNDLGDCPVIGVMLMLFKKKNIPLSDVYT
ncbi:MAG: hypothetical protein U9N39_10070 [Campylobacterota bacterium]|nr:hypothetical protein [Campylobacterota bacterium]